MTVSSGWRARSPATAGEAMYALKPSVAVMRTTPVTGSAAPGPSRATAWATCPATPTARSPSGVSSQPPAARASTRPPRAFSSAAILRATVVWLSPRLSPAVVNFPLRDTSRRTRSRSGEGDAVVMGPTVAFRDGDRERAGLHFCTGPVPSWPLSAHGCAGNTRP